MKKFLAVALVVLFVLGYLIYQDPQWRAYLERKTQQVLPDAATQQTLYRWRDQHGQWQLSDQPPAAGIKYETVQIHKDTNIIPAEKLTGKKSN